MKAFAMSCAVAQTKSFCAVASLGLVLLGANACASRTPVEAPFLVVTQTARAPAAPSASFAEGYGDAYVLPFRIGESLPPLPRFDPTESELTYADPPFEPGRKHWGIADEGTLRAPQGFGWATLESPAYAAGLVILDRRTSPPRTIGALGIDQSGLGASIYVREAISWGDLSLVLFETERRARTADPTGPNPEPRTEQAFGVLAVTRSAVTLPIPETGAVRSAHLVEQPTGLILRLDCGVGGGKFEIHDLPFDPVRIRFEATRTVAALCLPPMS